ncbi:MAG: ClpX C4-type zinc finger protein [Myxococcaceae bacterium]|nr:ClpX C4-type zinc finger protein [Myxococcaceae bacterium]
MASEIRSLLAAAQQAEASGDVPGAVRHLQRAADFYRTRRMGRRAAQMERHIDRLEGRPVTEPLDQIRDRTVDEFDDDDSVVAHLLDDAPFAAELKPVDALEDDGLGFGDELVERSERPARELSPFDRGPQQAEPTLEAWCSFCCRPRGEVGALIAGPAGAYICAGCVAASARLLEVPVVVPVAKPPRVEAVAPAPPATELPGQAAARATWHRRKPKVALVVGPEGTGKTALLDSLGRPTARPFVRHDEDTALVDLTTPLSADEERALLAWLEAHPHRRAVLAARGEAPTPVLVLEGEQGAEPVYDTDSLHHAVSAHVSPALLSKVDAVLPLPKPDRAALRHLAQSLVAARGIELPPESLDALVSLAEKSGRSARELAALIARIPAGRYAAR